MARTARHATTRIVVDLMQACRYELVPGSDNRMVLKLYTKPAAAKTRSPRRSRLQPRTVAAASCSPLPVAERPEGSQADSDFGSGHRFRFYRTFLSA